MCLNQIHSLNYVMVKVRWADWCGWLWVRKWWGHWEDLGAFNHKLPGFETFRDTFLGCGLSSHNSWLQQPYKRLATAQLFHFQVVFRKIPTRSV